MEQGKNNCCCSQVYPMIGAFGLPGPQGPPGPQGEPGTSTNGLAAYGGLYNSINQFPRFTTADQPAQVSFNMTMPLKNVSAPGNNTIVIQLTGDYEIHYNLLINTVAAVNMASAVRKNGTEISSTRVTQNLALDNATGFSYDGRLSASVIVSLQAGDVLDLTVTVVRLLPANFDVVINNNGNAVLAVKKLDTQ